MGESTFPAVLRISRIWNWNPVTWSWFRYEMPVHTKHEGEPVIGTVVMSQYGPLSQTKVTYP